MTEKLNAILKEIRPEFDFADSADFIGDGMLDSFDMVMLVSELDKKFSVAIKGAEIVPENFRNLASIAELLRRHGVAG